MLSMFKWNIWNIEFANQGLSSPTYYSVKRQVKQVYNDEFMSNYKKW